MSINKNLYKTGYWSGLIYGVDHFSCCSVFERHEIPSSHSTIN